MPRHAPVTCSVPLHDAGDVDTMERSLEDMTKLRSEVKGKVADKMKKVARVLAEGTAVVGVTDAKVGARHRLFVVNCELVKEDAASDTPWCEAPKQSAELCAKLQQAAAVASQKTDILLVSDGANHGLRTEITRILGGAGPVFEMIVVFDASQQLASAIGSKRGAWSTLFVRLGKDVKVEAIKMDREADEYGNIPMVFNGVPVLSALDADSVDADTKALLWDGAGLKKGVTFRGTGVTTCCRNCGALCSPAFARGRSLISPQGQT